MQLKIDPKMTSAPFPWVQTLAATATVSDRVIMSLEIYAMCSPTHWFIRGILCAAEIILVGSRKTRSPEPCADAV